MLHVFSGYVVGRDVAIDPLEWKGNAGTVCPLWVDPLIEIHENSVLSFQLTIKHTFHVTMCT